MLVAAILLCGALGGWIGNTVKAKNVTHAAGKSIWAVPEQYDAQMCDQQGTVEEITYQTKAYATDKRIVEKKGIGISSHMAMMKVSHTIFSTLCMAQGMMKNTG